MRIRYPSKRIIEVNKNKKKIHNDSKYDKSKYNDSRWHVSGVELPDGFGEGRYCQEQLAERVRLLQKELQETKRLMSKVDNIENQESGRNKSNH